MDHKKFLLCKDKNAAEKAAFLLFDYLLSFLAEFSQLWFAMPQLVLQADWQEVWHSPHPPFFALSQRLRVSRVLICFIKTSEDRFIIILADII